MAEIINIFKSYNGSGVYCILFILALMYLWFHEEDMTHRTLLVIGPVIMQILFFIPLFYYIYNRMDPGTYYRILWLLPMTLVIGYTAVCLIAENIRAGMILVSILLVLSGTFMYYSTHISLAENLYHIPQETIELCDMIKPAEGRERVWAAFPPSQVHYVRQYTTDIQLAFGRQQLVDSWNQLDNAVYNAYMDPVIDMHKLKDAADLFYCNYIVMEKSHPTNRGYKGMGLKLIGETENYVVYRNMSMPFFEDSDIIYISPYDLEAEESVN